MVRISPFFEGGMKKITALIILILFASIATTGITDKNFGSVIVTAITSIYDGDTFRCNIDGYPVSLVSVSGSILNPSLVYVFLQSLGDNRKKIKRQ